MPSDSTLPAPSPEAQQPSQLRLGPLMDLLEAQDPALRHLYAKAFNLGESNLVVILAPNNTGKTNVIRALKFFFYGHLPDCTEATAWRLIHDGTRAAAALRAPVQGWLLVIRQSLASFLHDDRCESGVPPCAAIAARRHPGALTAGIDKSGAVATLAPWQTLRTAG